MMFNTISKNIHIGDKVITLETGFLANQADGSVLARCGDTSVLCVVCTAKEDSPDVDFFPLTVNYIEKAYACGKIPGGFYKREAKQSEREILISRLIDRPIRPLFPKGYRNDIQIVAQLFSYDQENQPDTLAMLGASCALMFCKPKANIAISVKRIFFISLIVLIVYLNLDSCLMAWE